MLELKHVSYSYQSYQEEISQTWTISSKMGPFTALSVSLEQGNRPPSPSLAGLDNPKKGRFFDGRDIQTKGLATTASTMSPWSFRNYNLIDYLTPLENVRLVNKQAGKDILFGIGIGRNANQTQCPAIIWRAATTSGHCACTRFRSKHQSSWQMSRQET